MEEVEEGAVELCGGVVADALLVAAAVEDAHLAVLFDELCVGGVDFKDGGVLAGEGAVVVVGEENGARAFLPCDEVLGTGDAGVVVHGAGLLVDELVDVGDVEEAVLGEEVERGSADIFLVAVDGLVEKVPVDEVGGFKETEGEGLVALVVGLKEHDVALAVEGDGGVEDASNRILEDLEGLAPVVQVLGAGHGDVVALPGAVVADVCAIAIAGFIGDVGVDEVVFVQNVCDFLASLALDNDGVVGSAFWLCAVDGGDIIEAVVLALEDEGGRLADMVLVVVDILPDGTVHDLYS